MTGIQQEYCFLQDFLRRNTSFRILLCVVVNTYDTSYSVDPRVAQTADRLLARDDAARKFSKPLRIGSLEWVVVVNQVEPGEAKKWDAS